MQRDSINSLSKLNSYRIHCSLSFTIISWISNSRSYLLAIYFPTTGKKIGKNFSTRENFSIKSNLRPLFELSSIDVAYTFYRGNRGTRFTLKKLIRRYIRNIMRNRETFHRITPICIIRVFIWYNCWVRVETFEARIVDESVVCSCSRARRNKRFYLNSEFCQNLRYTCRVKRLRCSWTTPFIFG